MKFTGIGGFFEETVVVAGTIGLDVDSTQNIFVRSVVSGHTTTAIDISNKNNLFYLAHVQGDGSATRGIYLSNAAADECFFHQCSTTGNATAGWEIVSGCAYNTIFSSTMGGGDGTRVDNGDFTQWAAFQELLPQDHHEDIWPAHLGEGASASPVTISTDAADESNGAATTADYWGEPEVFMAPTDITKRWWLIGINIYGTTTNKAIRGVAYRVNYNNSSSRNGGNTWDEAETTLTVVDGTKFQALDLVWITSDYAPEGEVQKVTNVAGNVVTVARETSQFVANNTGLRWDHTSGVGGGNEVMYLIYRPANLANHPIEFDWSCGSAKDFASIRFHEKKEMRANDGLIIRSLNMTDSTNNTRFDTTVIYAD
jgi:hypothetical protein